MIHFCLIPFPQHFKNNFTPKIIRNKISVCSHFRRQVWKQKIKLKCIIFCLHYIAALFQYTVPVQTRKVQWMDGLRMFIFKPLCIIKKISKRPAKQPNFYHRTTPKRLFFCCLVTIKLWIMKMIDKKRKQSKVVYCNEENIFMKGIILLQV